MTRREPGSCPSSGSLHPMRLFDPVEGTASASNAFALASFTGFRRALSSRQAVPMPRSRKRRQISCCVWFNYEGFPGCVRRMGDETKGYGKGEKRIGRGRARTAERGMPFEDQAQSPKPSAHISSPSSPTRLATHHPTTLCTSSENRARFPHNASRRRPWGDRSSRN